MRLQLENTELLLRENRPLRLVNGKGIAVRCVAGTAWLTVAGEAADRFLAAGEAYRLESNGLALVEAVGRQASIRLEKACRPWSRYFSRFIPDFLVPDRSLVRYGR